MRKGNSIWSAKKMVVIHLHNDAGSMRLDAVKVNSKLELIGEAQSFDSIDELVSHFGKTAAYWLQIEGAGVLSRILDAQSDFKKDLIISGDSDDFYFSTIVRGSSRLVSFVRKSVIQETVDYFETNKLYLLGITCGIAPLGEIIEEQSRIHSDFILETNADSFTRLERQEQTPSRIGFQGNFFSKEELVSKAIAAVFYSKDASLAYFEIEKNVLELFEFNKFKKVGITSLAILFFAVIGNYFYGNYLNAQTVHKEEQLTLYNSNLSILDQLSQEEMRKQQLVQNSGSISKNYIAYYLDELGVSVPKDIRLGEMNVFPLTENLKEKRKVEIDQSKIQISGWTSSNVVLDDWIETINREEWVKSVELINYQKINDKDALFNLTISMAK